MDHMNLFCPFENKDAGHEDVLTRNFLYLIKALPEVRNYFLDLVSDGIVDFDSCPTCSEELRDFEVRTQVDSGNAFFDGIGNGTHVLSILISDDRFAEQADVTHSNRHARYDGIIRFSSSSGVPWLLVIENKPFVGNVWAGQLCLNLGSARARVCLCERPCCLSWRKIINGLGKVVTGMNYSIAAQALVRDFLDYVEQTYSWLRPYDTFRKCGLNSYLLQCRCRDVLSDFSGRPAEWHKGWMYKTNSDNECIKAIGFDREVKGRDWDVTMWLYAGDTMRAAKETYRSLNIDRLRGLEDSEPGFAFSTNLHFSFMQTNLIWFEKLDGEDAIRYANYWREHVEDIGQVRREEFIPFYDELLRNGFVTEAERGKFNEIIVSKGYTKVNLCPGFLLAYTWTSERAIELDDRGAFIDDFRRVKQLAFGVFDN